MRHTLSFCCLKGQGVKKKLWSIAAIALVMLFAAGLFVYVVLEWPTFGEVTLTLEQDEFHRNTVEVRATVHNGTNRTLWIEANRCWHTVQHWNEQEWVWLDLCNRAYPYGEWFYSVARGEQASFTFIIRDVRQVQPCEEEWLIRAEDGVPLPPGRYRMMFGNYGFRRSNTRSQPDLYAEFLIF